MPWRRFTILPATKSCFFVASLRIPIDLQVLGRVIRQEFVFVLVCISILDYEESSGPFFFFFFFRLGASWYGIS